jgi:hypothetical protein
MYKAHHVFPSTGEWGCTYADTLCKAYANYLCKLSGKSLLPFIVTLIGPNNEVLARVEK